MKEVLFGIRAGCTVMMMTVIHLPHQYTRARFPTVVLLKDEQQGAFALDLLV